MLKKITLLAVLLSSGLLQAQIDSTYYHESKKILDHFPTTKISAVDLYSAALEVYEVYNIIVPYQLAIAQAIIETSLGNAGVGKTRNNPFSINSKKGYVNYPSMGTGVKAYYYFMATKYLQCKTLPQLLRNFVNCNNKRYAKDKLYERKVKNKIKYLNDY